jgi:hypothetical protein
MKKSNSINYITMTELCITENLGSQMNNFAALYCIARQSGHKIIFFKELTTQGKSLQLHKHFKKIPIEIKSIDHLTEYEKTYHILPIDSSIIVDSRIFNLKIEANYNFTGLFNSYKNWYQNREEIYDIYSFEQSTINAANLLINKAREINKSIVSVHVRRTDYLNDFHDNATIDYYKAAFKLFDNTSVNYLVFSDDIPWCQKEFSNMENVFYSDGATAIIDMAAMSLCDHNIIANSSFSFWGALLNKNKERKVICPAIYLKNDKSIPYLNFAWYPDEFTSIYH